MSSPNLSFKVVVMSATLDTRLFMEYFWGPQPNPPQLIGKSLKAIKEALFAAKSAAHSSQPGGSDKQRAIEVGARRFTVQRVFLDGFIKSAALAGLFLDLDAGEVAAHKDGAATATSEGEKEASSKLEDKWGSQASQQSLKGSDLTNHVISQCLKFEK